MRERSEERSEGWRVLEVLFLLCTGTGSGVGTKILEILKDEFPDVYRYVYVYT